MNSANYRTHVIIHFDRRYHYHGAVYSTVTQAVTDRCSHNHPNLGEAEQCSQEMVSAAVTLALRSLPPDRVAVHA